MGSIRSRSISHALVLVGVVQLGGCSALAVRSESIQHDCSLALPVVDTTLATAGLVADVALVSNASADQKAHGLDTMIHTFVLVPAIVYAISATVGLSEVNRCSARQHHAGARNASDSSPATHHRSRATSRW